MQQYHKLIMEKIVMQTAHAENPFISSLFSKNMQRKILVFMDMHCSLELAVLFSNFFSLICRSVHLCSTTTPHLHPLVLTFIWKKCGSCRFYAVFQWNAPPYHTNTAATHLQTSAQRAICCSEQQVLQLSGHTVAETLWQLVSPQLSATFSFYFAGDCRPGNPNRDLNHCVVTLWHFWWELRMK